MENRISSIQGAAGNLAVQRLLCSGAIQTKLMINQPGDVYEKEADHVAEQVLRTPAPKGLAGRKSATQEHDLLAQQRVAVSQTVSEDLIQRQPDGEPSAASSHPEIAALEGFTEILEGWKRSLQEQSAWIASQIPDSLVPGTAEYARAWQDLFDELLLFASYLGATFGKSYLLSLDDLDADARAQLDALKSRLDELMTWNAEAAYNELLGHLPNADVINIRMGSGLPWPHKGVHYVGRLGNVEPDGVLTEEWLVNQGFVRLKPQPGLGVTEWRHPETGVRVILLPPKGKKAAAE